MEKTLRAGFSALLSHFYKIDVSPLFATDVGEVIRSFQVVSSEKLCHAFDTFTRTGRPDDFALLLKVGAALDNLVDGTTLLMRAVYKGNLEAVQMLLRAGAATHITAKIKCPQLPLPPPTDDDLFGPPPAALGGLFGPPPPAGGGLFGPPPPAGGGLFGPVHPPVQASGQASARDTGLTALHIACMRACQTSAELLITEGKADVNAMTTAVRAVSLMDINFEPLLEPVSPLHIAAFKGPVSLFKLLLSHGGISKQQCRSEDSTLCTVQSLGGRRRLPK
uniref:Uncharacterized protein n=1 Tax=Chromera velia CCMP2878 TaxID=1169474 RepID=A0A0G4I601_9ALVE|eukprot:Cvel_11243.t1-p1 / transcript=Cvel_11243.t1 / gene=Cvel_11243 / organism=Chromera_velia_CCMP2878 / gene_product=hypothetical protein / transcript_product=hypothetical protein / location=Cvel_scaffold700:54671-55501(+) / protein_length=277 / sequence_SO=supercontig / SO=protein_coding / is_pseudo=false